MLCKRENRRGRIHHGESEFSNASIFYSMERFIRRVHEMEDTILIPSRLLDLTVGDSGDKLTLDGERGSIIKATVGGTDLFQLYNTISQMKVELLWSRENMDCSRELEDDFAITPKFEHSRCVSSSSIHSVQSTCTSCDSDSDLIIENDPELDNEDGANAAARAFKRHLRELHRNIEKMTYAAEYLTKRYQSAINQQI